MRQLLIIGLLCLAELACGGKVGGLAEDSESTPDGGMQERPSPPRLQRHLRPRGRACGAGAAIDPCVSDCERHNRSRATCQPYLDEFLRCMVSVEVKCAPDQVVIVGCSDERIRVEICRGQLGRRISISGRRFR